MKWVDEGYEMLVYADNSFRAENAMIEQIQQNVRRVNILMIVAVTDQESIKWIQSNSQDVANVICFDSSPSLTSTLR